MSPLGAIAIVVFAGLLLLGASKRYWAVVMILTFSAFEQLLSAYSSLLATRTWVTNVAVGVCALASLAVSFVNGERPVRGYVNATTVLVFVLYAFAGFGVFYSSIQPAGVYFIKTGFPYYVLMLVILPMLVNNTSTMNKIAIPIVLTGIFVMGMILISPRTVFYGLRMFVDLSYARGGGDERGNPLAIGELAGLMILMSSLVVTSRGAGFLLLLRVFGVLLGMAMCVLASVRGQLVFAVFFSALLFPLASNMRNIKQFFVRGSVVGAVVVGAYAVFKIFLSGTDSVSRFSAEEIGAGFSGRMYFVTSMLSEYGKNPANYLQGLGTGAFNAVVAHNGEGYLYPHNLIIEVLTHHGVIGFSLLAIIFVLVGRSALYLYRAASRDEVSRGSVAITLALTGYVTMISMKQGSFLLYPLPFYMFIIVVRMHKLALLERDERAHAAELSWDDWDDAGSADAAGSSDGYSDVPLGGAHPA